MGSETSHTINIHNASELLPELKEEETSIFGYTKTTKQNLHLKLPMFVHLSGDTPVLIPPSITSILSEVSKEIDGDYQLQIEKHTPKSPYTPKTTYTPVPVIDDSDYEFVDLLGKGSSSRVMLARNIQNNKYYAVKKMSLAKPNNTSLFHQERRILKKLNHPNIVCYVSSYSTFENHCLVTNYYEGEDLLNKLLSDDLQRFPEDTCVKYVKSVLHAIDHMHENNIVHRDLKLDNLIFETQSVASNLRVIDFGFSEIITKPNAIDTVRSGTLHYMSPEVLSNQPHYKEVLYSSDMWSVGIICFIMMVGQIPFAGSDGNEVLQNIILRDLVFPKKVELSDECKDFILCLLRIDCEERLSAKEALDHDWIVGCCATSMVDSSSAITFSPIMGDPCDSYDWDDISGLLDEIDQNY